MTERTHDLAALTTLTLALIYLPVPTLTIGTLAAALIANQIGSAVPDLDQPTAEFYRELPVASFLGKIVAPFLGGHRLLSHTLIGLIAIGAGLHLLLGYIGTFLLVNMDVVWWAFILGYVSHLLMDTLTREGVPWLFPLPFKFGFPPFKFLRVRTGTWSEKLLVYPGLIILNGYLIYTNYGQLVAFFSHNLVK